MRPRNYAQEIMKLKTLEERRAYLERVPEEWRALVKKHVEIAYDRMKYERNQANTR